MASIRVLLLGFAVLSTFTLNASSDTIGINILRRSRRQTPDPTLLQILQGLNSQKRTGQIRNSRQGYAARQSPGFRYNQGQSGSSFDQGFGSNQEQGYGNLQEQGYYSNQGQGYGSSQGQGYGSSQGQAYGNNQRQGYCGNQGQGYGGSQGRGSDVNWEDSDNGFLTALQLGGGSSGNSPGEYGSNQGGYGGNQGSGSWMSQRPPLNVISNENSIDEQTTLCIRNCLTTAQYDPVCGDDNVTYQNLGKIKCAQEQCNKRVSVAYNGVCVTPSVQPPTYSSPYRK